MLLLSIWILCKKLVDLCCITICGSSLHASVHPCLYIDINANLMMDITKWKIPSNARVILLRSIYGSLRSVILILNWIVVFTAKVLRVCIYTWGIKQVSVSVFLFFVFFTGMLSRWLCCTASAEMFTLHAKGRTAQKVNPLLKYLVIFCLKECSSSSPLPEAPVVLIDLKDNNGRGLSNSRVTVLSLLPSQLWQYMASFVLLTTFCISQTLHSCYSPVSLPAVYELSFLLK